MTIVNQPPEKKTHIPTHIQYFVLSDKRILHYDYLSKFSMSPHLAECGKVNGSCPCLVDLCNWLIENYEAIIFA